jgi:hypothetical protein
MPRRGVCTPRRLVYRRPAFVQTPRLCTDAPAGRLYKGDGRIAPPMPVSGSCGPADPLSCAYAHRAADAGGQWRGYGNGVWEHDRAAATAVEAAAAPGVALCGAARRSRTDAVRRSQGWNGTSEGGGELVVVDSYFNDPPYSLDGRGVGCIREMTTRCDGPTAVAGWAGIAAIL